MPLKQPGRQISLLAAGLLLIGLALLQPARAQSEPVEVEVRADAAVNTTRLVLSHSGHVEYTIHATSSRIEISYARPIRVEPAEAEYDDGILKRHRVRGDHELILVTGTGYRGYDSFDLRNPFRLVLDLQGRRPDSDMRLPGLTERDDSKTIVVLDPGHGGVEMGAVGPSGLKEKDVTLDLARRLRQALQTDRSISVVLTRDEDRLVGLDERTAIANHNRADLFVSIHLNASRRTRARGAETYFLAADATDDAARTTAALENRSHGVDEDSLSGGSRADELELVLWDLAQAQYLVESSLLGERMQRHLNEVAATRDRGVKQAPFRVLMGATMPAILVEVGFISNPDEEARFKTLSYRNQVVDAMAVAVQEYLRDLERLAAPGSKARTGSRR